MPDLPDRISEWLLLLVKSQRSIAHLLISNDLVLIQASALLPGEPWAYATDPAAVDRGRRLARMIVMARALGKPVVTVAAPAASR